MTDKYTLDNDMSAQAELHIADTLREIEAKLLQIHYCRQVTTIKVGDGEWRINLETSRAITAGLRYAIAEHEEEANRLVMIHNCDGVAERNNLLRAMHNLPIVQVNHFGLDDCTQD